MTRIRDIVVMNNVLFNSFLNENYEFFDKIT